MRSHGWGAWSVVALCVALGACGHKNAATPSALATMVALSPASTPAASPPPAIPLLTKLPNSCDDGADSLADASGTAARFDQPDGLAVDAQGNIYVADSGHAAIRHITPDGQVSTLAKAPPRDHNRSDDRPDMFRGAADVAVAADGTVYVADTQSNVIRRISPSGEISTLAGQAWDATGDGQGEDARFGQISGLAIDAKGNLYASDSGKFTIRRISPQGQVSTVAGQPGTSGNADGANHQASFGDPAALAVDSAGTIYVADSSNASIRLIGRNGTTRTMAGRADSNYNNRSSDGPLASARFDKPVALALDRHGTLYVSDAEAGTLRKVADGRVSTLAGRAHATGPDVDGKGKSAHFPAATAIAIDSHGRLLLADGAIRRATPGGLVSTVISDRGNMPQYFIDFGFGIAVDSHDTIYGLNQDNSSVARRDPDGRLSMILGPFDKEGVGHQSYGLAGLVVDSAGNFYVGVNAKKAIWKITPEGKVSTLAGGLGTPAPDDGPAEAASFLRPAAIALAPDGSVYVADSGHHTIRRINPGGRVSTIAGLSGSAGSADGPATSARFNNPQGIAIDPAGNLYVSDSGNHTIRKITSQGQVSTLAGRAGNPGSADGKGPAAQFMAPRHLSFAAGNLLVADSGNLSVRRVSPAGVVTTLGHSAGPRGEAGYRSEDPTGPASVVAGPRGMLYVSDRGNCSINQLDPASHDAALSTFAGQPRWPATATPTVAASASALLSGPKTISVDPGDNLYVGAGDVIVKINPAGEVLPVLTGMDAGSRPGAGAAQIMGDIHAMAVDRDGTVYALGYGLFRIQPDGRADTLVSGSSLSSPANSPYAIPLGMSIDTDGKPLIVGQGGQLGKPGSDGNIQTVAGRPPALAGAPGASAAVVDAGRSIYVAGGNPSAISRISPEGSLTRLAGRKNLPAGTPSLPPPADGLVNPIAMARATDGTLYILDSGSSTLLRFRSDGQLTTLAGSFGIYGGVDGTGTAAQFDVPEGLALAPNGNLYVADTGNHSIRLVTPAGQVSSLLTFGPPLESVDGPGSTASITEPVGVAVDASGQIVLDDAGYNTVRRVTADGMVSTLAGLSGRHGNADGAGSTARFGRLQALTIDSTGNIYVVDQYNASIRKITPAGIVSTLTGSRRGKDGSGDAIKFGWRHGLACDRTGNLYVTDTDVSTIRKISPDGNITTLAGATRQRGKTDGLSLIARFNSPEGVAVAADGTVYVADTDNNSIRAISPQGLVSTLAGSGQRGCQNGKGLTASFNGPQSMAIDRQGQLYVADNCPGLIRKISPNGAVSTLQLRASVADQKKYPGLLAFGALGGIAVDSAGNLYVTCDQFYPLRKITPAGLVSVVAGRSLPMQLRI